MTRDTLEQARQRFDDEWHGGHRASYPPTLWCTAAGVWECADAEAHMRGEDVPPTYPMKREGETT